MEYRRGRIILAQEDDVASGTPGSDRLRGDATGLAQTRRLLPPAPATISTGRFHQLVREHFQETASCADLFRCQLAVFSVRPTGVLSHAVDSTPAITKIVRQTGSHVRVCCGECATTVPVHS